MGQFHFSRSVLLFPLYGIQCAFFLMLFQKFFEHSVFRSLGEMECLQGHQSGMI